MGSPLPASNAIASRQVSRHAAPSARQPAFSAPISRMPAQSLASHQRSSHSTCARARRSARGQAQRAAAPRGATGAPCRTTTRRAGWSSAARSRSCRAPRRWCAPRRCRPAARPRRPPWPALRRARPACGQGPARGVQGRRGGPHPPPPRRAPPARRRAWAARTPSSSPRRTPAAAAPGRAPRPHPGRPAGAPPARARSAARVPKTPHDSAPGTGSRRSRAAAPQTPAPPGGWTPAPARPPRPTLRPALRGGRAGCSSGPGGSAGGRDRRAPESLSMLSVQAGRAPWPPSPAALASRADGAPARASCGRPRVKGTGSRWGGVAGAGARLRLPVRARRLHAVQRLAQHGAGGLLRGRLAARRLDRPGAPGVGPAAQRRVITGRGAARRRRGLRAGADLPLLYRGAGREGARSRELWSAARAASSAAVYAPRAGVSAARRRRWRAVRGRLLAARSTGMHHRRRATRG